MQGLDPKLTFYVRFQHPQPLVSLDHQVYHRSLACLSASSSVLSCKVDQLYSSFPAEVTQYTTSQVEPIPLLHEFETYIPLIPALGSLPQIP